MNYDMQKGHQDALSENPQLGEMDRTLIQLLAARTGADPRKLEADFRRGDLSALLSSLPRDSQNKVSEILSDPKKTAAAKKAAEKAVQSDAIGRMMQKKPGRR